jgi:protein TonB
MFLRAVAVNKKARYRVQEHGGGEFRSKIIMIKRLIIPAILTGAVHALILFGFNEQNAPRQAGMVVDKNPFIIMPPPIIGCGIAEERHEMNPMREGEIVVPRLTWSVPTIANPVAGFNSTAMEMDCDDMRINLLMESIKSMGSDKTYGDRTIMNDDPAAWDVFMLDQIPRVLFQNEQVYQDGFRDDDVEIGSVTVEIVVDEQGNVIDAGVVKSTHRKFEEPTLRAVGKWRFEPGRKNGVPVRFRMQVPVMFSLNDSE